MSYHYVPSLYATGHSSQKGEGGLCGKEAVQAVSGEEPHHGLKDLHPGQWAHTVK